MIDTIHPVALIIITILVIPGVTTFVIATYKRRDVFSMSEVGHTYLSGVLVLSSTYSLWSDSPHFLFYSSVLSMLSTDIVDTLIINRSKLASLAYDGFRAFLLSKINIPDPDKKSDDTNNK